MQMPKIKTQIRSVVDQHRIELVNATLRREVIFLLQLRLLFISANVWDPIHQELQKFLQIPEKDI